MKSFKRTLALLLSISLFSLTISQSHAAVVANNQLIHPTQFAMDKDSLLQSINKNNVQEQLKNMGVASADIKNRIEQMTHEEIAQLNEQINELPAGSGALGAILLVFVIFVITDVIGATDIFPFIHPINK